MRQANTVKCVCCGANPTHQLSLYPGVETHLYFCERCYRCTEHAFDPEMVESRIQLIARAESAEARLPEGMKHCTIALYGG